MDALRKPVGAYLVLVAIAVAVFFIVNPLLDDSIDVPDVWSVIDILMLIALALGLLFAYLGKQRVDAQQSGDGVSRAYLEANVTFFAVAAITVLFLHSWFSLLAGGAGQSRRQPSGMGDLGGLSTRRCRSYLGVLGCRLWRGV